MWVYWQAQAHSYGQWLLLFSLKSSGLKVINLECSLKLKTKHIDWLLADTVHKQPIIALYFKSENELKFYNLRARLPLKISLFPITALTYGKEMGRFFLTFKTFLVMWDNKMAVLKENTMFVGLIKRIRLSLNP